MKKIYVYIALILMCINLISCDGKPSKPAAEFATMCGCLTRIMEYEQ